MSHRPSSAHGPDEEDAFSHPYQHEDPPTLPYQSAKGPAAPTRAPSALHAHLLRPGHEVIAPLSPSEAAQPMSVGAWAAEAVPNQRPRNHRSADATSRPPFARMLREFRHAVGMTQEELATRAGIGVRTVRDLEAGRAVRPQRSTVELMADALALPEPARTRFTAASRGRPVPLVSLPRVEPLIGRADDVAAVNALLDAADLVTIVGLAGVGKSVVALAVAQGVAERFPGGVGAVRVTDASTEAEVLASAVAALGASHVSELTLRLAEEPALLVVSRVDRSRAAAKAAISWLREHTRVRVLATSRQPLGLPGEYEWTIGPLDVPPADATDAAVFTYPAAKLFLERLRRVRSRPVHVSEAATLGALVRRLGGLPIALELAAARGRVLDLRQMLVRSSASRPPGSAEHEGDPAGQSVRAAVLASWELLTAEEQTCLCWLSVFQWRWSLELAEELLAVVPGGAPDLVAVVDRLVSLGLVRSRSDLVDVPLHIFDAVRQVALDEAAKRAILGAARDQHAVIVARICARAAAEPTPTEATEALLTYLLVDIQAAAAHVSGTSQSATQRAAGSVPDLRRGLVRWLEARDLTT